MRDDRLWLQESLNRIILARVAEEIERRGRALPCHVVAVNGSIVTVAFDLIGVTMPQVTIPKLENPYFRQPTQVGDKGTTQYCDTYLGGVSGLGGGTAGTSVRGNLAALYFVPISNQGSPPPTGYENYAVAQGPDGVFVQDLTGAVQGIFSKSNGITLSAGGHTMTINSSGITLDGILWDTHTHLYTPGSGTPTQTGDPQ